MAKGSFAEALSLVLRHEGGYVNLKADPGGATNKGVTQRTYNGWRRRQKQPMRSVKEITSAEIQAIYRQNYWDKVRGDDLPAGIDYAVFDFAVNSGPKRAAQFLQRVLGVNADGIVGSITIGATSDFPPGHIIAELCNARLTWLKRLKHWSTFGKGWTRRVSEVENAAMEMTLKPEVVPVPPPPDDPGTELPSGDTAPPKPPLDWIALVLGPLVIIAVAGTIVLYLLHRS